MSSNRRKSQKPNVTLFSRRRYGDGGVLPGPTYRRPLNGMSHYLYDHQQTVF